MCEHCYEKVDDGQTHALSDSNIDLNDQSNWNCEILSRDERGEPKCLSKPVKTRKTACLWVSNHSLSTAISSAVGRRQLYTGYSNRARILVASCATDEIKLRLSLSAKRCRNPCSTPPPVYQDLSTCCDWPVKKANVANQVERKFKTPFR